MIQPRAYRPMMKNWNSIVTENDSVIVPGDISWATYIDKAVADFSYLDSLNGKKLILKGNHAYWWPTLSKMNAFLTECNFNTIEVIQNNAIMHNDIAICGTRGWNIPSSSAMSEDRKIFEREKQRLILSLEDAKSKKAKEIIVAMHYPPIEKNSNNSDFLDIMSAYGVKLCIFGHLHAQAHAFAPVGDFSGIELKLVSCDYLNFIPALISR